MKYGPPEIMRACILLAAAALLPATGSAQPQDFPTVPRVDVPAVSLQETSTVPGGEGPPLVYTYRNEDHRAITAYRFECVFATQNGRSGYSAAEADTVSVVALPEYPGREARIRRAFTQPGGTLAITTRLRTNRDGPFALQTCGLVALIFDDGQGVGSPEVLDRFYAARRSLVASIEAAHTLLSQAGTSLTDPRQLSILDGLGLYAQELEDLRNRWTTTGRMPASGLSALDQRLRGDLERLRAHLRASDLEALQRGDP